MAGSCCSCSFEDTPILAGSCSPTFTLFMGLIDYLLRQQCNMADPCGRAGRSNPQLGDGAKFDYIVVGAGVAGSVVASRLAELNSSVLVVEAGPEEPTVTQVPGFAFSAVGTTVDWNYTTQPEKRACLGTGGVCAWPRGKMVGGTFAMNGMMYSRGHPSIYDSWAAEGNPGWSFEEVLPYFKKAESNRNPELVDDGYHGFDGPLVVQRFPYHPRIAASIVRAGHELGYRDGDFSGRNQTGIGLTQVMVADGLRASTSRMYLRRDASRANVHLLLGSQVGKVIVQKGRALGVEYVGGDGVKRVATARQEVILSAGAIGSPQILLLSGVGPRRQLRRLGVPVQADLPVGRNLHNHVGAAVRFMMDAPDDQTLTLSALGRYLRERTGPLASTGLTQLTGFLRSGRRNDSLADLQLFLDGYGTTCSRTGMDQECADGQFGACGRRAITARPTNLLPRSRGELALRSKNPGDHPLIRPNYFAQEEDVEVLLAGVRIAQRLFLETEALKDYDFRLDRTPVEGCEGEAFDSDAYWRCAVGRDTEPENHQAGSCRMAPAGDPTAVVDPQLRVHGVPNLRVVDASVFPLLPNGNPVSAIVMVAEKAADMIKESLLSHRNEPAAE